MVSENRQRVIETNRSIRLIKNELESLLEKGVITDAAYDSIHNLLPAEAPAARSNNPTPAPAALPTPAPSASPAPAPGPPSYSQSTATPPPPPPPNNPPPAAAPEKPVLVHTRALYRYTASDARDCSFERDDGVAVYEYMNADWWMGRNTRTGQEGIFPRAYVVVVDHHQQQEKMLPPMGYHQPQYAPVPYGGGYPAAPPPGQPADPYQQQQQQQPQQPGQQDGEGGSKIGEHGKNIGKKLGNAAIFGAGATIGSNIVNSIF
ncbi:SH3 domain-containing protein [Chaetomidium leptoderma]|uniref:SH3 domain-containing protein n=1 Tax=Chaetomidium leptoderma TaxID=669021 RepID=A0AAN6VCK6_9PEZI|nr:SH3 domain-containing protein [Chaetomidium leptoderma]